MNTDQKIIKNRVGLLELAKQLGNVSQACNILGYSRESFYRYQELYKTGGEAALADGFGTTKSTIEVRRDFRVLTCFL